MELKDYTIDELRAELKRRNEELKAQREAIPRCRKCKHFASIDYWGNPQSYITRMEYIKAGLNCSCPFFKTKNGKNYLTHSPSQKACEHFEKA